MDTNYNRMIITDAISVRACRVRTLHAIAVHLTIRFNVGRWFPAGRQIEPKSNFPTTVATYDERVRQLVSLHCFVIVDCVITSSNHCI